MNHYYALIMAGGSGTRLWPLSRRARPKQVLPLVEDKSMFQLAIERLHPLLPPERIIVVASGVLSEQLRAAAPQIPPENFVVEPSPRNSGPAVGLGTIHIRQRDPDAVIAVLASDHHIAEKARFRDVLAAAATLAQRGHIVTLGISASFPSTGFGYIRRGEPLSEVGGFQAYTADQFTEKPDVETAIDFVTSGEYSWNSGMFIWTAERVMREFQRQQPAMHAALEAIAASISTAAYAATLERHWPEMTRLSVDYALMERAENVAVIPVDIGWSDVGSWASLYEVLTGDLEGNIMRGERDDALRIDTRDTLVISDRMVVTIGVEKLIIVDTDDALLVCHRDRSQDVREVVERLRATGLEDYL